MSCYTGQRLREDLMKLPGRDATRAEAEAVSAEIAALQADIERGDATITVRSRVVPFCGVGGLPHVSGLRMRLGRACGLTERVPPCSCGASSSARSCTA